MANRIETYSVFSGWQYRVFEGCDMQDGEVLKGTADSITGGSAPTEQAALALAKEVLA